MVLAQWSANLWPKCHEWVVHCLHYATAAKRVVRDQTVRFSIPCLPCKHVIHQAEAQLLEAAWYPVYFLISAISCNYTSIPFLSFYCGGTLYMLRTRGRAATQKIPQLLFLGFENNTFSARIAYFTVLQQPIN